jgi:hypothetical protein
VVTVSSEAAALARQVRSFAPLLVRAIRACRLYPPGSALRQSNLDACYTALTELLAGTHAVTYGVREGALTHRDEVVYADDDVRTGPSHLLASHAIFELSFQAGVPLGQLDRLVRVLAEDQDHRRRRGEDMVTLLWRHHFTHIRHRYVDVLATAVAAEASAGAVRLEDDETVRLRRELRGIVERLSIDQATGHDFISLADRSLLTPEACQAAIGANEQRLAWATAAFRHRTSPRAHEALTLELSVCGRHEELAVRLAGALLDSLARHPDPCAPEAGGDVLRRVYAELLDTAALAGVKHLVDRARALEDEPRRPEDRALGAQLLDAFVAPAVVDRLVTLVDTGSDPREATRASAVLGSMGERALAPLVPHLDRVERASTRELVSSLVVELALGQVEPLIAALESSRTEAAAQLLRAAQVLPPAELAQLTPAALVHKHPSVRAVAVRIIAGYAGPTPDALVIRALGDPDVHVRTIAARAVAQFHVEGGARAISSVVQRQTTLERDPVELRALFHAHAVLSGADAVEDLGRLLSAAASITGGHRGETIDAAATALAATGSDVAREVLSRGARSLNPRLRGPCKAALAHVERSSAAPEDVDGVVGSFTRELSALSQARGAVRTPWPTTLSLDLFLPRRGSLRPSMEPSAGAVAPRGLRPSELPSARPSASPTTRSSIVPPLRPSEVPVARRSEPPSARGSEAPGRASPLPPRASEPAAPRASEPAAPRGLEPEAASADTSPLAPRRFVPPATTSPDAVRPREVAASPGLTPDPARAAALDDIPLPVRRASIQPLPVTHAHPKSAVDSSLLDFLHDDDAGERK